MPPIRLPSRLLTPRTTPFLLNTRSNTTIPLSLSTRHRQYASITTPDTTTGSSIKGTDGGTLSAHPSDQHGDHGHGEHESHYDPPGGWLWGIRPGEKYEKEGWENLFWYGFCGSWVVAVGLYVMKEDTS